MLLVRDRKQILADWVRDERTKREWSQSDLADRIGKVRAVINKKVKRKLCSAGFEAWDILMKKT